MQEILAGGLRLAGLSMRMVLALFMAKYLSFHDIGIFALLVGLTGLLPGAAGLGLSYFVNRDIIGMASPRAMLLARDRLILTTACGIACSAGLTLIVALGRIELPVSPWICALVIVLEMIGFDLHLLLIARHRTTAANFLLFMRSAFWIPVFMALAYAFPSFREIDALVRVWLAGLLVYILFAGLLLRQTIISRVLWTTPFDHRWLQSTLPRAMLIWLSDFALAVGQNIDRFIISSFIGVAAAGVYYFYFSIANAAFLVVQSATIQPYMPRLRALFSSHAYADFVHAVRRCMAKLIGLAVVTFVLAEVGTVVLISLLGRPELAVQWHIMPILLVGMLGKAVNDYLGIVDYIMERDARFVTLNVLAFVTVITSVAVMTKAFSLTGAASGVATTMILFAFARWMFWRIDTRHRLRLLSTGAAK